MKRKQGCRATRLKRLQCSDERDISASSAASILPRSRPHHHDPYGSPQPAWQKRSWKPAPLAAAPVAAVAMVAATTVTTAATAAAHAAAAVVEAAAAVAAEEAATTAAEEATTAAAATADLPVLEIERVVLSPSPAIGLAGTPLHVYIQAFFSCFGQQQSTCGLSDITVSLLPGHQKGRSVAPCANLRRAIALGIVAVGAMLSGNCPDPATPAGFALEANLAMQHALQAGASGKQCGGGSGGEDVWGGRGSGGEDVWGGGGGGSGKEAGGGGFNNVNGRCGTANVGCPIVRSPRKADAADAAGAAFTAAADAPTAAAGAGERLPRASSPEASDGDESAFRKLFCIASVLEATYFLLCGNAYLWEDCLCNAVESYHTGYDPSAVAVAEATVKTTVAAAVPAGSALAGIKMEGAGTAGSKR
ncbi:unnamed protein product, partial [Phaeothamnion confervicola]